MLACFSIHRTEEEEEEEEVIIRLLQLTAE